MAGPYLAPGSSVQIAPEFPKTEFPDLPISPEKCKTARRPGIRHFLRGPLPEPRAPQAELDSRRSFPIFLRESLRNRRQQPRKTRRRKVARPLCCRRIPVIRTSGLTGFSAGFRKSAYRTDVGRLSGSRPKLRRWEANLDPQIPNPDFGRNLALNRRQRRREARRREVANLPVNSPGERGIRIPGSADPRPKIRPSA